SGAPRPRHRDDPEADEPARSRRPYPRPPRRRAAWQDPAAPPSRGPRPMSDIAGPDTGPYTGRSLLRREDRRLLTGPGPVLPDPGPPPRPPPVHGPPRAAVAGPAADERYRRS